MADIKLSQLGQITTLDDDDILLVSQDSGGGSFISKSIKVSDLITEIGSTATSTPVGIVQMWTLNIPPTGYLECNGTAVNRTTFSDLFSLLGITYGSGNGSTTFNLPDYRGEFLRGWAHGSTNDPDKASRTSRGDGTTGDNNGTKQAGGVESHKHTTTLQATDEFGFDNKARWSRSKSDLITPAPVSTSFTGGNETRPRNVNIMYIIKT